MKKILTALIFLLILSSICFAEMTEIEKAYFKAKEPSNDPIVGFWKGFHITGRKETSKNNEEYYIILPAPEDRPEWDYTMVAFKEISYQKPGDFIVLLRKTENESVYFAKLVLPLVVPLGPMQHACFAPVIYSNDGYFDFSTAATSELSLFEMAPVIIKIKDHIVPEIEKKYPPEKDESWREILAPAS